MLRNQKIEHCKRLICFWLPKKIEHQGGVSRVLSWCRGARESAGNSGMYINRIFIFFFRMFFRDEKARGRPLVISVYLYYIFQILLDLYI